MRDTVLPPGSVKKNLAARDLRVGRKEQSPSLPADNNEIRVALGVNFQEIPARQRIHLHPLDGNPAFAPCAPRRRRGVMRGWGSGCCHVGSFLLLEPRIPVPAQSFL